MSSRIMNSVSKEIFVAIVYTTDAAKDLGRSKRTVRQGEWIEDFHDTP